MSAVQTMIDEAGATSTLDATPTPVYSWSAAPDCSGYYRSIVCARRVSDGAAKQFTIDVGFRRVQGNASITNQSVQSFGTMTIDAYAEANGADVQIIVAGLANNEVDWTCVSRGITTTHGA